MRLAYWIPKVERIGEGRYSSFHGLEADFAKLAILPNPLARSYIL